MVTMFEVIYFVLTKLFYNNMSKSTATAALAKTIASTVAKQATSKAIKTAVNTAVPIATKQLLNRC